MIWETGPRVLHQEAAEVPQHSRSLRMFIADFNIALGDQEHASDRPLRSVRPAVRFRSCLVVDYGDDAPESATNCATLADSFVPPHQPP